MSVAYPATQRRNRRPLIIAALVVIALVILLGAASTFFTELLWFRETGYTKVFWAGVWVRPGLGVVFGAAFALALLVNLWIARRITSPRRLFTVPDQILERYRASLQPFTKWLVVGGTALFALFAGSGASVEWREWLLFRNGVPFGEVDPIFHKDIGFYVFRLPFHRFVFTWAFSTLFVVTAVTALTHYLMGGIRPQARGERVAPEVRAHLSVLLGLMVLLKAWGYRLDQFNLLLSARGQVTGASYTDVNAQLPSLKLLVVIAIVCALFFFVNAKVKNWILPLGGIALLALTSIVAGGIYPATVQRFRVTPNEQLREVAYIERNILATRKAFGITDVEVRQFPALPELKAADIDRNKETIKNIRLWDPFVLKQSYLQLQRIKQYYEFLDVDVDRYRIGGRLQQVMLSAREVAPADLTGQAQTWLNRHLVYTHGYGAVVSRVERVTAEGQPSFIVRSIPPVSIDEAPQITQPRIYFGEKSDTPFTVVNSQQDELDYPQSSPEKGDTPVTSSYEGRGGIQLRNVWRRAAFAWRFRDANLMISGAIDRDSRILMRRRIDERVRAVAPFLRFDSDPYIAILDGRLVWIVDAYTTTTMYPYAERISLGETTEGTLAGQANYIRNAVKFVIDAEDGTIVGYRWDEQDPILRAWDKTFPGIFRPRSAMPPSLLEHVRYPEALFRVQTNRYANYHISSARDFYLKEDAWEIAHDPTVSVSSGRTQPPIQPYYVLMRLPGEDDLSFVLVRPFTPNKRQNLTAYMAAHGDPDDYGKLVAYAFPKSDVIFGPEQVQSRINSDPEVSRQISFWNQQNSSVIYGNLIIVPIEESLLYVQPLYLLGQGSLLPELKRVVAVAGESVKMGDTLDQALAAIFGKAPESTVEEGEEAPPIGKTVADLIAEALEHDQKAQDALRRGDFAAYGREQDLMRQALERAAEGAGSPSPSATPT